MEIHLEPAESHACLMHVRVILLAQSTFR